MTRLYKTWKFSIQADFYSTRCLRYTGLEKSKAVGPVWCLFPHCAEITSCQLSPVTLVFISTASSTEPSQTWRLSSTNSKDSSKSQPKSIKYTSKVKTLVGKSFIVSYSINKGTNMLIFEVIIELITWWTYSYFPISFIPNYSMFDMYLYGYKPLFLIYALCLLWLLEINQSNTKWT